MTQFEVKGVLKMQDEAKKVLQANSRALGEVQKKAQAVKKPIAAASKQFGDMGSRLGQINPQLGALASSLQSAVSPAGALALAVGLCAKVIYGAVKEITALGATLVDLSVKTTLSLKSLQELGYVGTQVGVSMETLANAVLKMQRRIGTELPETVKWLQRIGLSTAELKKMDPGEAFAEIASAISRIPSPMEQSAAAMGIFGQQGLQILPVIRTDVKELVDEFHDLGGVIDDETLEAGKRLDDEFTRLGAASTGLKGKIAGQLIPTLTGLVYGLRAAAGAGEEVKSGFEKAIETIPKLAPAARAGIGPLIAAGPQGAEALELLNIGLEEGEQASRKMAEAAVEAALSQLENNLVTSQAAQEHQNLAVAAANAALNLGAILPIIEEEKAKLAENLEQTILWGEGTNQAFQGAQAGAFNFGMEINGLAVLHAAAMAQMNEAFAAFGLTTKTEMEKTVKQLERAFKIILKSGEATAAQLQEAWEKLEEARRLATGETKKFTVSQGLELVGEMSGQLAQLGGKFKIFAIAEAMISTYLAAAKSLAAYPWPFSMFAVAGAIAAGLAQVAMIKKQSFKEGTRGLDFEDFGPGTQTMLHGREAVIPRGGGHQLADEIASSLAWTNRPSRDTIGEGDRRQPASDLARAVGGGGVGGGRGYMISINLSGAVVGDPHRLAQLLGEAIGIALETNEGEAGTKAKNFLDTRA